MDHVDFYGWAEFIARSIHPNVPKSILDLGCGTGTLLKYLPYKARKVGLDSSPQMLEKARENFPEGSYFQGNIEKFDLPERFDLILCTHDTVNYLLEPESLENHFSNVYRALIPCGYYFFDISSEYNLQVNFHKQIFKGKYENFYFIWENEYDPVEKLIYSTLRFTYQENGETVTQKEVHVQKYYPVSYVESILEKNNFRIMERGSDYKTKKVHAKSSLLTYLVQKKN
jgi:SAM-dependent methyltransferase